ncbi:hypothetical protein FLAG1_04461 [Fusarium langsethiae]|uniref:Zinc finger PHD-type domain-containing protein n=1 Tax=Fusarium langsethiae TaxID=179993 RepID=A0A0M9EYU0_FUSLA|nr:hypothetical protein FLAG1_04461 [Fusarium langsethiae]GKU02254.1 unnamed protein product [Fusarium langsethiae]
MPSRKRPLAALDGDDGENEPSLQHRIRNMWQFANLCQWIYIFGKAAKIDEAIDVEEIEAECLKPNSTMLADIALALLKLVSSHRGLTHEIFDDQVRKQFANRSPNYNPFDSADAPLKFNDFDIFTKIKVMQQLTQWVMIHPERIRDKMEEQKDAEQTSWRIEPYGWDANDRTYFVLDDNRIYRLTEAPPTIKAARPKKPRVSYGSRRSSKRRRSNMNAEEEATETDQETKDEMPSEDDGLGGMTWECLAVTLDDVRAVVDGFRKTRDENEKILRDQLEEHLVPILERQEQSRQRRELQRDREIANAAKMANAKRSSRIAGKIEQQRHDEHLREEERQRREEEANRQREELAQTKKEKERNKRMVSREQRLRERETRRIQHEEELAQLSEDSKNLSNSGRVSERRLKVEIERNKQALKELEEEEDDWIFDCSCGLYGQVDDGAHSVACERCNVWQHSKCMGLSEEAADLPEFHYICTSCTRREQEAKRPRPTIKLKLNCPASSGAETERRGSLGHDGSLANGEQSQRVDKTSDESRSTVKDSVEDGLALLTTAHGTTVNGADFINTTIDARPGPSRGLFGTPKMTPVIPAPVKLDASFQGSPSGSAAMTSPMTSFRTPSPSKGIDSFQGDKTVESALSTPQISREIYRAAHEQNGTLPSTAGLSPTKHSPPRPLDSAKSNRFKAATPILPPVALSPSPQHQILTPPTKHSEPPRPFENR